MQDIINRLQNLRRDFNQIINDLNNLFRSQNGRSRYRSQRTEQTRQISYTSYIPPARIQQEIFNTTIASVPSIQSIQQDAQLQQLLHQQAGPSHYREQLFTPPQLQLHPHLPAPLQLSVLEQTQQQKIEKAQQQIKEAQQQILQAQQQMQQTQQQNQTESQTIVQFQPQHVQQHQVQQQQQIQYQPAAPSNEP